MGFSNLELNPSSKTNKGFSTLLDLSLYIIEDKWENLLTDKVIMYYFNHNKTRMKITVKLADSSYVKATGNTTWVIGILQDRDKREMIASFIHELTHISQRFNKFTIYEQRRFKEKHYEKIKAIGYSRAYDYLHDKLSTEYEAKLMSLLWYLKNNHFELAVKHMKDDAEYFVFNYKQFIRKAYAFGVKDKEILHKLKRYFITLLEEKHILVQDGHLNKGNNKCLGDYFCYILEHYQSIAGLFNIDLSKYYKWLNERIEDHYDALTTKDFSYNWVYIHEVTTEWVNKKSIAG